MMIKYKLDKSSGHIKALDGLRGLAIILVLAYHLFPYIKVCHIGWIGVDLFFVLSGFLITGILLDSVNDKHYWRNFWVRRMLRIFPLYYFTIILFVIICSVSKSFSSYGFISYGYFQENQFWFWSYLVNWKILAEGQWLPVDIFNIFWSLAIEEQFYLFWPLVVLFFKIRIDRFILIALICVVAFRSWLVFGNLWPETAVYTNTFTRIDTILIGALIAIAIRRTEWRNFLEKYAFLGLLFSFLLYAVLLYFSGGLHPFNKLILVYGYTINYVFFGFLLVTLLNVNKSLAIIRHVFEDKIMVFFGKYSYSIYIYHWGLYLLLNNNFTKTYLNIVGAEFWARFASSLTILALVLILSQITWIGLEKRFLKLKRYF